MNTTERAQRMDSYGQAYETLIEALKQFPKEMWQFRPAPGKWSIHEIIIHITDSEANSYIRCRRLLAEPGSAVLGYKQDEWTRDLSYHKQSTEEALELFKLLRLASYRLILSAPESAWAHTIEHSENGTMTMDDWLMAYERHIPVHISQMQRNYLAWTAWLQLRQE